MQLIESLPSPASGEFQDFQDIVILEGHVTVRAAICAGNRDLHALYAVSDRLSRPARQVIALAEQYRIPVVAATDELLADRARGRSHGGLIALAGPRRTVEVDELARGGPACLLLMLDGVEDPYNLGHSLRALYAAGVNGLIVRSRDWRRAEGTIARSSAGASEWMPLAMLDDPYAAARFIQNLGFRIACAVPGRGATPVFKADLTGPTLIVVGGEKRGIGRGIVSMADLLIDIPYARRFRGSLGLTAAATLLAFEAMRQRSTPGARIGNSGRAGNDADAISQRGGKRR